MGGELLWSNVPKEQRFTTIYSDSISIQCQTQTWKALTEFTTSLVQCQQESSLANFQPSPHLSDHLLSHLCSQTHTHQPPLTFMVLTWGLVFMTGCRLEMLWVGRERMVEVLFSSVTSSAPVGPLESIWAGVRVSRSLCFHCPEKYGIAAS